MADFNWQTSLKTNTFLLNMAGLWPKGNETYKLNSAYTFYAAFCLIGLFGIHTFTQVFNIFFIDDLETFTSSIFITLACVGGVAKTWHLIRNMTTLKQLFVSIADDIFQPRNARQIALITPSILFWQRFYLAFRVLGYNTLFFWAAYPIFDKKTQEHHLPFVAWYPYDSKISPLYEITYVHQIVAMGYAVLSGVNTDMLIAALNMFIAAQCEILCDDLKHLGGTETEMGSGLVNCVKHHRAILKFAEKSNSFFNWIVLWQFLTSAVSIGVSLFQLTLVAPFSSEFYSFLCFGITIITEMFIFCWFGNEVEVKSSAIPYSAFECDWVGAPLPIQKNLHIFTLRTQRPIKLSVVNLFYLTLDTFKSILQTSWSYFTVLSQASSPPA